MYSGRKAIRPTHAKSARVVKSYLIVPGKPER